MDPRQRCVMNMVTFESIKNCTCVVHVKSKCPISFPIFSQVIPFFLINQIRTCSNNNIFSSIFRQQKKQRRYVFFVTCDLFIYNVPFILFGVHFSIVAIFTLNPQIKCKEITAKF